MVKEAGLEASIVPPAAAAPVAARPGSGGSAVALVLSSTADSCASVGRPSGSFSRAWAMIAQSGAGSDGSSAASAGGRSVSCLNSSSPSAAAPNGRHPVSIW